jgi:hypothetical protein
LLETLREAHESELSLVRIRADEELAQMRAAHTKELMRAWEELESMRALRTREREEFSETLVKLVVQEGEERERRETERNEASQSTIVLIQEQEKVQRDAEMLLEKQRKEAERKQTELEAKLQEQMELETKLRASLTEGKMTLPEEENAWKTRTLARIQLRPSEHFQGTGDAREQHFRLAESQFFRMCCTDRKNYKVTLVEYIVNPILIEKYNQFKAELEAINKPVHEILTFHGTSSAAIDLIVSGGFKIGGQNGHPILSGAAHGQGVYTSEDPSFAIRYIKDGQRRLLFTRTVLSDDCKIVKSGSVIQQLICKNAAQVLPCYVVHFSQ